MKIKLFFLATLTVCVNVALIGQIKTIFNPKDFANKTILSKIEIKNDKLEAEKNETEVSNAGSKMRIGKGIINQNVWRSLSIQPSNDKLILKGKITKVVQETESRGAISTYDSENRFERDGMATSQGATIDPLIDKEFVINITSEELKFKNVNVTRQDFDNFWSPKNSLQSGKVIAGIFFNHLPINVSTNLEWSDSLATEKPLAPTIFKVKSIDKEKVTIMFTKTEKDGAVGTQSNVKATSDGQITKGEMIVDKKNGFIYEMNYKLESRLAMEIMGQKTRFDVDSMVKIVNTVK